MSKPSLTITALTNTDISKPSLCQFCSNFTGLGAGSASNLELCHDKSHSEELHQHKPGQITASQRDSSQGQTKRCLLRLITLEGTVSLSNPWPFSFPLLLVILDVKSTQPPSRAGGRGDKASAKVTSQPRPIKRQVPNLSGPHITCSFSNSIDWTFYLK